MIFDFFRKKKKIINKNDLVPIEVPTQNNSRSEILNAFSQIQSDMQSRPFFEGATAPASNLNTNGLNTNSFTPFPSRTAFNSSELFTKLNAKNDIPDYIPYTQLDYLYQRSPIAKRLCTIYPNYCWNPRPVVLEINNNTGVPVSEFERACAEIADKVNLFEYIQRADIGCQKGQYSVLYVDFNDRSNPKDGAKDVGEQTIDLMDGQVMPEAKWSKDWKNPATGESLKLPPGQSEPIYSGVGSVDWASLKGKGADAINYVTPYEQPNAWPTQYVVDYNRPGFALVNYYNLQSGGQVFGSSSQTNIIFGAALPVTWNVVHSSRCVHFIDNNIGNNILGLPILYPCFNDLVSVMRVSLASATVYDYNARGGLVFSINTNKDQDSQSLTQTDATALKTQVEDYLGSYRRAVAFENIDVKPINFTIESPEKHIETYIQSISSATGVPTRILMGNEAGRLASDQDKKNFDSMIKIRQEGWCTKIVKQFFDPLIAHEVIPAPKSGTYKVHYPLLDIPDNDTQAQNFNQIALALANLGNAQSVEIENNMEDFVNKGLALMGIDKSQIDLSVKDKDYRSPDTRADDLIAMFGDGNVEEI